MPDPFSDLASLVQQQVASQIAGAMAGIGAELGTITDSGLKLDGFGDEIPDYLISTWPVTITLPAFELRGTMTPDGGTASQPMTFNFEETAIEDVQLSIEENLMPGDRVLVLSVNDGRDPVVVCKVVDLSG